MKTLKYLKRFKDHIISGVYTDEAEIIVAMARNIPSNSDTPNKAGGYLAVCNAATGDLICLMVGAVRDDEKKRKYQRCATEKATRLFTLPGDVSSFRSADADKDWYGGGIKHKGFDLIVAFSGFSAQVDEAISIAYCSFCIAVEELGGVNSTNKHLVNMRMLKLMADSNKRFCENPAINELAEALREK